MRPISWHPHFSDGEIDQAFSLVNDDVSWRVPGDLPFSGTKTKAECMDTLHLFQLIQP
jgi:hypothetical protein